MLKFCGYPEIKPSHPPRKLEALFLAVAAALALVNNVAIGSPQPLKLTSEERAWLEKNDGKIILAPTPNYPPIDFIDENGRESGIAGDYINLIENKLDFRFKVVNLSTWGNVVIAAKQKKIDATSIAQKTPERDKFWLFTQPYLTVPTVIISSNRIHSQLTLESLRGLKVAIVKSYGINEYISSKYPALRLIPVPSDQAGLQKVSVGELDAMIADLPTAAYFIEQEGLSNLRIAGQTGYSYRYSIATRKDLPILHRILNKALASISPAEKESISEKWVRLRVVHPFDWRLAWLVTTTILAIVLAILIWNWSLRRRVHIQTDELTRTNKELQMQIEENRRTLEALKDSETRFRNIVQNIPGAVYQLRVRENGTTYFAYISPQAKEMFGIKTDSAAEDWKIGKLIHPDDQEEFYKSITSAYRNRTRWNYEGRLLHPSGSTIHIHGIASPTKVTNEVAFDGILLDVSERKLSQEMLLQSERQFRELIEQMPVAIVVHTDEVITYVNPQTVRMARAQNEDEIVNRSVFDFMPPALLDGYRKRFEAMNSGSVDRLPLTEGKLIALDGREVDIEGSSAFVIFDGKPSILSMFRDITERKLAEKAMKTYEDIVNNMQSGLHVFHLENPNDDRSLRLVDANPASAVSATIPEKELLGKLIDDILPGMRERDIPARLANTALTGQAFSIDDFVYDDGKTGQRHYSIRVFAIPDYRVGVLFEDVTAQKQTEDEKRQFYRDTISSVTDGKLVIASKEEVESFINKSEIDFPIESSIDTVTARQQITEYFSKRGLLENDLAVFTTAIGEATTNAIKHAGGGKIHAGSEGQTYWVAIADEGPGIAALALPKATLKCGHSTKLSMGMGYTIILDATTQVILYTGPKGTTVVLVKDIAEEQLLIRLDDLPDAW